MSIRYSTALAALLLLAVAGCDDPIAKVDAGSPVVLAGGQTELTWSVEVPQGTTFRTARIEPDVGTVGPSGSITVTPSATTTYVLTAITIDRRGREYTGTDSAQVDLLVPDLACDSDDLAALSGGMVSLGATRDLVALCDAWVLRADADANTVEVRNLTSDIALAYQLFGAPVDLEVDATRGRIYASTPPSTFLTYVDTGSGIASQIPVPEAPEYLTIDSEGRVYMAAASNGSRRRLYVYDPVDDFVDGPFETDGAILRFNRARGELLAVPEGTSRSSLTRYAYARGSLVEIEQLYDAGGFARDLAVSPDGERIAFASGSGNGTPSYTLFDFAADDLGQVRGEWPVGAYPSAVAFGPQGRLLLASDGDVAALWDVPRHRHLAPFTPPEGCSYGSLDRVMFSRGGQLAMGVIDCGISDETSILYWEVIDPSPAVELAATRPAISLGDETDLSWNVQTASGTTLTGVLIEPAIGAVGASGSVVVSPDSTTTYRIVATAVDGQGGEYETSRDRVVEVDSVLDCTSDVLEEVPASGAIEIDQSGDIVPLCDGWAFVADRVQNRVVRLNLIDGREGASYEVSSRPGALELDLEGGYLLVAMEPSHQFAVIDLDGHTVTEATFPDVPLLFTRANASGEHYVQARTTGGVTTARVIYALDPITSALRGPWSIETHYGRLSYNAARDELVTGRSTALARIGFDGDGAPFEIQEQSGFPSGLYTGLALSPDGTRLAYGGTDVSAADLTVVFGAWAGGGTGAFSPDGTRFAALGTGDVRIFDVTTHVMLDSQPASCSYASPEGIGFSRGGALVLSHQSCGFDDEISRLGWLRVD